MQNPLLADHIIDICKRLHNKNMLAAGDGNISFRVSDEEIWVTPTGVSKSFMSKVDMAIVNINGQVLKGHPSSELKMHLEVYKQSAKATAVIHAHPPHGIAWSIAFPQDRELPVNAMSELILSCGQIPIVPFAMPGTSEMAENLRDFIPENRVLILARHGALTWGESLEEAYKGMERLEHSAQILTIAKGLGGVSFLPDETVEKLKLLRLEFNKKTEAKSCEKFDFTFT
jgi:L-fuculose-phosphate aldolase